jgi:hypothetical protein
MNFDLRLPLGVMFAVYGLLLTIFGFATNGNEMYATHSLGINVNLRWGLVLLLFGAAMLGLALKKKSHNRQK